MATAALAESDIVSDDLLRGAQALVAEAAKRRRRLVTVEVGGSGRLAALLAAADAADGMRQGVVVASPAMAGVAAAASDRATSLALAEAALARGDVALALFVPAGMGTIHLACAGRDGVAHLARRFDAAGEAACLRVALGMMAAALR